MTATCQHCGGDFTVKWPSNPNRYCSRTCSNRANARSGADNPNPPKPKVTLICAQCETPFDVHPSRVLNSSNGSPRRFCSRTCDAAYRRTITGAARYNFKGPKLMACEVCGTEVLVRHSLIKRFRACSKGCAAIIGLRMWPRESSLETAMRAAFAALGLEPEEQYPIDRATADFAFPAARLVVECDGSYWHTLPHVAARDRRRDRWLRSQGWRVLRLTEESIRADAAACATRVVRMLG